MGIFSTKRKTYVSSSVWNMAGDVNKRPNFLKTTVFNHVINGTRDSIADSLTETYAQGPGIRLRRFSGWAERNFDAEVGNVEGGFMIRKNADPDVVAQQIGIINGVPSTEVVRLQSLNIGLADYTFWAEKHILENKIGIANDDWTVDFNGTTKVMHFTYPDGSTEDVSIPDYDERSEYLYAVYQTSQPSFVESTTWDGEQWLLPDEPFPDVTGFNPESNNTTPHSQVLTNKVTTWATYSDGRPQDGPFTSTTTDTKTWDDFVRTYIKDEYQGNDPDNSGRTWTKRTRYSMDQTGQIQTGDQTSSTTEDIGGGVIKTNWTRSEYELLYLNKHWLRTIDKVIDENPGALAMFIYKSGGSNAVLNAMFERQQAVQSFLPFIPFRVNNRFLSNSTMGETYIKSKKAFTKATGGQYNDVMKELKKNADIGDIDYIYTVFGVSLNTPSQSGRKYIYTFFHELLAGGIVPNPGDNQDYAAWVAEREAAEAKLVVWTAWKQAQSDPSNPLFGTAEPERPPMSGSAPNSFRVYSKTKPVMNYDYSVLWNSLRESVVAGLYADDMKVGEYRIEATAPRFQTGGSLWGNIEIPLDSTTLDECKIVWQESASSHRIISLIGLDSKNMIYNGKAVEISAKEAMDDQEESGFLIPIQMDTYKKLSLKDQTQLAMSNTYIVCNAYQVVTKKWYQRGAFQIVLIIIVIIITIVTWGGGAAAAGGILGSNAAVGAALGVAAGTLAAVIVGAIANAIAAALVMRVIQYGANKWIGGKWGQIIGAIVAVIAVAVGSGMANGQTFTSSLGNLARSDNLLKLTEAGLGGYSQYINASTMDYINQTNTLVQDYKEQTKQISDAWANAFGTDRALVDPSMITDAFGVTMEDVNTFLTRTTMNGQDIAEISLEMILGFVDSSLNLDLPT